MSVTLPTTAKISFIGFQENLESIPCIFQFLAKTNKQEKQTWINAYPDPWGDGEDMRKRSSNLANLV